MKEAIERRVLEVADSVGLGPQFVEAFDAVTGMADFDVDPEIRNYSLPDEDVEGHVLFPVIEGDNRNAYRYYILAHAFRCRGYRPIVPLCDADLGLCMRKAADWPSDAICNVCHHYGSEMAEAFGIDTTPLAEELPSSPEYDVERYAEPDPEPYRNVAVSEFAKASTRKHFRKFHLSDSGVERRRYLQFVETACKLTDAVNALFDRYEFETAFANDAVYVYGGVPLAVADDRGVVGYSHGRGYRDGTVVFGRTGNRSVLQIYEDEDLLREFIDRPLSEPERERTDEIMAGRRGGSEIRHRYSALSEKSIETSEETVAGMFTNLVWDASLEAEDAAYPDVFAWIEDTIDWFADQSDCRLVIKVHPAESKRGTNERVGVWIENRYDSLPDNVTLLSPDTDVNTYQMIEDIDVGLVYSSTVGIEMAYHRGPVVVAGDTHYRDLGLTYDASSTEEYVEFLNRLGELEATTEMQDRGRRYAYHYFVRKHVEFPYYRTDDETFEIELLPVEHDDIVPGNEPFDSICEWSLAGNPILNPDAYSG